MEKESNSSDLAMTGDAPGSGRARRRARGANAALTVRAIVDGDGHAGRDILRGVIEYIEQRTGWHLAIDVNPLRFVNPEASGEDGFIYASSNAPLLARLLAHGRPIVGCFAHHEASGIPVVRTDDAAIGRLAARYFLERGFESFVFDAANGWGVVEELRFRGFADTLRANRIEAIWRRPNAGPDADLETVLRRVRRPVALLAGHDVLARHIASRIREMGLHVPDEVAVLGVDNDELFCGLGHPSLSTIEVPYWEIGYKAAQFLHRILRGRPPPAQPLLLRPLGVISRESTDTVALDDPKLAAALRFIRQHACDPCTVKTLVMNMGVGRRWLELRFRQRLGHTPHREILRVRIEQAKVLLRDSRLPLREVAARTGFAYLQNFVAVFRRQVGETPAVHRRLYVRSNRESAVTRKSGEGRRNRSR